MTGPSPAGGELCPRLSSPQQTAVPAIVIAHVCSPPALIALIGPSPGGGELCPKLSSPQQTAVPAIVIAHACLPPALIAVIGPSPGGELCPQVLSPQHAAVPAIAIAHANWSPALIAVTGPSPGGGELCPQAPSPQQATVPPAAIAHVKYAPASSASARTQPCLTSPRSADAGGAAHASAATHTTSTILLIRQAFTARSRKTSAIVAEIARHRAADRVPGGLRGELAPAGDERAIACRRHGVRRLRRIVSCAGAHQLDGRCCRSEEDAHRGAR